MSIALRSVGLLDVPSRTLAEPRVARPISMPNCAALLQNPVSSAGWRRLSGIRRRTCKRNKAAKQPSSWCFRNPVLLRCYRKARIIHIDQKGINKEHEPAGVKCGLYWERTYTTRGDSFSHPDGMPFQSPVILYSFSSWL